MGLFGKGNVMNMNHYEGLPNFHKGYATTMELDEENHCLRFRARAFKNTPEVRLPLDKITKAGNVNITEIEQQSKVGRAVIGGLLFGNAGAIVGAMTAGEKKKLKTVYIINYVSGDETKVIVMQSNGNPNYFKFQERLNQYLPKPSSQHPDEIVL
ncbi:hypothetical protein [Coprococcus comes]|uniref:hypothetical protein n=1 Tax=Coprococcus comes TaxID=410072 RepID=UPI00189A9353|nr:hypothetical protein [Coprococcus comes]